MRTTRTRQTGSAQLIGLIVVAVVLAVGYVALDFYSAGEQYKTITEARGLRIIEAIGKQKRATNAYPDTIAKLAPKYMAALPRCPAGEQFSYTHNASGYTLGCDKVGFKMRPYRYDSRTRTWSE